MSSRTRKQPLGGLYRVSHTRTRVRVWCRSAIPAVAAAFLFLAASAHAAEVALHYSTYQEERFRHMPGEYQRQFNSAGAVLKDAGVEWERLESKEIENGALAQRKTKVLVISYVSVMSRAEADAIAAFVKASGKLFVVYASCNSEYRDGRFGDPDRCLIADALGMDWAGTAEGCRALRVDIPDHPVAALLPPTLLNAHGWAVRMRPHEGTRAIAGWLKGDLDGPLFAPPDNGAILVSPSAVYVALFLWRLPEAKLIAGNALDYLLGRPRRAPTVVWERQKEAPRVEGGINLACRQADNDDVDAIGLPVAERQGGVLRPTCAVVYPADAVGSYYVAKRLARALSCPLVPDQAAARDHLESAYDLLLVGRLAGGRCENLLGNIQRGIAPLIQECSASPGKAVIRVAPTEGGRGGRRRVLLGGSDSAGLLRAEALFRQGIDFEPGADEGKLLVWQPVSAFGDLVYPWTPAGEPLRALVLPAAVNQRAKAQFVLTAGMGYRTLDLDLKLSPLTGLGGAIPARSIQLLATRYVRSGISHIPEPDPLVPADRVSVEPGGHQQMWLIADTAGLKPGVYGGELRIVDGLGHDAARLAITVDVAPIRLTPANRHDLLCPVWDYLVSSSMHGSTAPVVSGEKAGPELRTSARWSEHYQQHFRERWRAYVDDLEAHGVNVMFLSPETCLPQYQAGGRILDEDVAGKLVSYGKQHGFRLFIFTQILGQHCYFPDSDAIAGDGSPIFSAGWDDAYKRVLRAYVQFAARAGLGFSDWAVYPYDEPHTDHARRVVNHVRGLMAQVDRRIQLWSDPARASGQSAEAMLESWKSMEKSIDIWWPSDGYIASGTPALSYLKGLGKPFGFYRCAAYATKDRSSIRPDRYYRMFGWEVAERGAGGMGFWTWAAWLGDSWDDEDCPSRTGDGAVIYEGPEGPVTSISWEAWSEGLDDYKYLTALKAAIAAREGRLGRADPACGTARKLLSEAVASVIRDPRAADTQRARVREEILKLL